MNICFVHLFLLLFGKSLGLFLFPSEEDKSREKRARDECALFMDPNLFYVKENGPSYIELDAYDFTGDLEVSFWMLPDQTYYNGALFNVGSEDDFKYYEWKTKAINVQFMVVEVSFGAVSLLTKALQQQHLHQIELYTTYPTPYNLLNQNWQHIIAKREKAEWTLSLNNTVNLSQAVTKASDVNLFRRKAFLGSRPGYVDNVFRGIIKDLYVNGEKVRLKGRPMSGNAKVVNCNSAKARQFAKELVTSEESEAFYYDSEDYESYEKTNKLNRLNEGRGQKTQSGMTWKESVVNNKAQPSPLYF